MYGVDINETYCGNHFAVYTIIKSVYSTTETNIMYVSYNKKIKETFVEGGLLRRMGQWYTSLVGKQQDNKWPSVILILGVKEPV